MMLNHDIKQALINLMAAKLRSFLAVLGILIGTAAIVALVCSGQLATEKALSQFKALGTDLLAVSIYQKERRLENNPYQQLSLTFWRQLPQRIPAILRVAPYRMAYQPMYFQGKTLSGAIIGADDSLAQVIHIELEQGRFVSFLESFEHVCVIGHGITDQIKRHNRENPLGQQLHIGNLSYTIIGTLAPWKENGFFNEDINQAIIIPINGMTLISKDTRINNAVLQLKSNIPINRVIARIKHIIHQQAPTLNIFIRSAQQIIASMESQGHTFTLLLAVIGGIALLVGGIGIMNVMLVSVSERKKEIGIRKAIGAKNRDIQTLFLIESIILSLLGGVLGVILGFLLTWIIAYFSHWPFTFHVLPLITGFSVSVVTGIFFGFYPARRAALLDPIVSLRQD